MTIDIDCSDTPDPRDVQAVDDGLDASNHAAVDLRAVQPLGVYARDAAGTVVGGVLARSWGRAAEIQQLWVRADLRRQGIGRRLLQVAEARLQARGCVTVYLDTFSWQAPALYRACGYAVAAQIDDMPDGGVKYLMRKQLGPTADSDAAR